MRAGWPPPPAAVAAGACREGSRGGEEFAPASGHCSPPTAGGGGRLETARARGERARHLGAPGALPTHLRAHAPPRGRRRPRGAIAISRHELRPSSPRRQRSWRQRERRCGGNVQHGSTGKTRPPQPRCSQQPPRAPAAFLCGLRWTITHCEYGLRACVFCGRAAPQERPRALHQAAEPGAAKGIPGVCWLARAAACLRVRVRVRACACSDTHAGCLIVVRDTRAGGRARMCACCAGWCRVRA